MKTLLLFAVGVYVQQFLICEDLLRWCYLDFFGAHLASQALIGQGASLPMIDLGARANNSGRDLDLIAHWRPKAVPFFRLISGMNSIQQWARSTKVGLIAHWRPKLDDFFFGRPLTT